MCVKIYIHVDIFSLSEYFAGTDFQQRVWNALLNLSWKNLFLCRFYDLFIKHRRDDAW